MKKILLSLIAFAFITSASAKDVLFHSPFSTTGNFTGMSKILAAALGEKGWDIDVKVTTNAKLSKETYVSTDKPMIMAWSTGMTTSKSDDIYLPAADKDLVGGISWSPWYFCSTNEKNISIEDFKTRKLTIGIDLVGNEELGNWMDKLQEFLGTDHTYVTYKGSKKVTNAIFSGEVDMGMTTGGAGWVEKGKATCFYTSAGQTVQGIKSIKEDLPKFDQPELQLGLYWRAVNLSKKEMKKLRKDFASVKESSADWQAWMDRKKYVYPDPKVKNYAKTIAAIDEKLPN
tara:strand:- start:2552 stop:3412 length:861 start_codon:yes stop_codon:yes gene_type:complete